MRYAAPTALSLAPVLVSSSSDSDSSDFRDGRVQLQSSFQDLEDVNIRDDGLDDFDSAVDDVLADADTLKSSASELQPEVDALRSARRGVQTAVGSASTDAEKITAADGLSNVSTAGDAVDDAAGADCD